MYFAELRQRLLNFSSISYFEKLISFESQKRPNLLRDEFPRRRILISFYFF